METQVAGNMCAEVIHDDAWRTLELKWPDLT